MRKDLIVVDETDAFLPVQIVAAGDHAARRFVEFFTANIRNANTRQSYARAVADFFRWCDRMGLHELGAVEPVHVAGYIEQLGTICSAPTVKQHLAAVRMLFDWLVVGQVVPINPASVVRGPSHVIKRGKTPVLSPEEAHELFASIPTDTVIGLRDRAFLGVLIYSFARVSAALGMRAEDYFPRQSAGGFGYTRREASTTRCWCTIPSRRIATSKVAGLLREPKSPLFRASNGKTKVLSDRPFERRDALKMVQRRAKSAGIKTRIGNHTFRATGITIYLTKGGDLEKAQQMAAHESPRTTKLYDRRSDAVSLDEVEKVVF
jgi:site-specific recombinase XerD